MNKNVTLLEIWVDKDIFLLENKLISHVYTTALESYAFYTIPKVNIRLSRLKTSLDISQIQDNQVHR